VSVRIYELSREFDIPNKEVIEICRQEGLEVKSHSSTIDEDEADLIRRRLAARLGLGEEEEEPEPRSEAAAAEAPAPPAEAPAPAAPAPEVLSPEEQLARARQRVIRLPSRPRRRPKARGLKLPRRRRAEETPEAPVEAEAEAPAVEAPAPTEVAETPTAEAAPAAASAAPPAPTEAPATEPSPTKAPPAEPVAPAARTTEAPPRRIPPRPKLAPKPKPRPKLAPKPTRPAAHPQRVTEEPPPEAHPQRVGIGVGKKRKPPARPGRKAGAAAAVEEPAKPAARAKSARRGRRERPGEESEGVRRARAFRQRERTRQREELEEIGTATLEPTVPGQPTVTERGRRGLRRPLSRPAAPPPRPRAPAGPRKVVVEAPITVKSLSAAIGVKASDIIRHLMMKGTMARINDTLDEEQALEIALAHEVDLEVRAERPPEAVLEEIEARQDPPEALVPRPPVVTFLGHVDHGKTSLMDTIRKTHVAAGEAGGITQHIGAYRVHLGDRWVTFLDTPGHEAFTAMRARGAQVTDVAVLVVAADDGVMPQTEEAINHARAAGVPIVVAINKCDLPQANPDRVRQQLTQYDLLDEKWGGKTICIETSAVTGQNVDALLEALFLEAEMLELRANPDREALGTVIEAQLTEGMGPLATLLVQNGTLRRGDVVLAGTAFGRVRTMQDENGRPMEEAGPAVPVRVAGLSAVPEAGDRFYVLPDLALAKDLAEQRARRLREVELAEQRRPRTLEAVFEQLSAQPVKELHLILKADVQGTLEALRANLEKIEHPEVGVRVIHAGVGGVTESDVLLADASDAIIIGFNAVPDPAARALAEQTGVEIRLYNVIYHVTEDVKKALEGLLAPEEQQRRLGEAEVLRLFRISRVGTVAGCRVTDGTVPRHAQVRVVRDGLVVFEGRLDSLKHGKDDVREVRAGQECGMHIEGFDDVKVGDRIEAFEIVKVARTLDG